MTQMELQNLKSKVQDYSASEYTLLIKRAAQTVSQIRGGIEQVMVQIGEDAEAIIETKIGTITWNGAPLSSTSQYEAVIDALHKALGEQPAVVEATSAQVEAPPIPPTLPVETVAPAVTPDVQVSTTNVSSDTSN